MLTSAWKSGNDPQTKVILDIPGTKLLELSNGFSTWQTSTKQSKNFMVYLLSQFVLFYVLLVSIVFLMCRFVQRIFEWMASRRIHQFFPHERNIMDDVKSFRDWVMWRTFCTQMKENEVISGKLRDDLNKEYKVEWKMVVNLVKLNF